MFNSWSPMKRLIWLRASALSGGVHTVTGDVVNFTTSAAKPLISLVADINFAQSGSGDPSPTNVRAITGRTGVNVYRKATYDQTASPTVSVTFPATPGTVYGGTLNVTSGKLTVTYGAVDLGFLSWYLDKTSGANQFFRATVTGRKYSTSVIGYCSCYKWDRNRTFAQFGDNAGNLYFGFRSNGNQVFIRDDSYSNKDDFATAVTGQTLVYPLATPAEYNLTAQEIETLVGTNYIWADTGNVTVKY